MLSIRLLLSTLCIVLAALGGLQLQAEVSDAALKAAKIKRSAWTHFLEIPRPPKKGKPQAPGIACIWLPDGVETIRGLLYPGQVMIDNKLGTDGKVRAALAKHGFGVLRFQQRRSFIHGGGEKLQEVLQQFAEKSGHSELAFVPWLTVGHSAAGLFCRNVAYWQPDRVIAVVMIKSGNFHHGIADLDASLKGVPLVHIPGEFEEFGPEGGDLGKGLRAAYATKPSSGEGKSKNQTQWVMTRMQMLERRRKHADNLWSLIVHRGGSHTKWNGELTDLFIAYMDSTIKARLPAGGGKPSEVVRCKKLTASDGWLYDADIKNPKHKPAAYADYTGNKLHAFWVPDQAMAEAIHNYHNKAPWTHPDPTAGQPDAERYMPPALLKDFIDAAPPEVQAWPGGDGRWSQSKEAGAMWTVDGKEQSISPHKQAHFTGSGGTVSLDGSVRCTGLELGDNYTLNIGTNRITSVWHGKLAEAATISVVLHPKSPGRGGRHGGALTIGGNGVIAGKLIVTLAEGAVLGDRKGIKGDQYCMVSVKGRKQGDFSSITLPDGLQGEWQGNKYLITVPKATKK